MTSNTGNDFWRLSLQHSNVVLQLLQSIIDYLQAQLVQQENVIMQIEAYLIDFLP